MLPVVIVRAEEHGNGWCRQVAAPFAWLFLVRVLEYEEEPARGAADPNEPIPAVQLADCRERLVREILRRAGR